MFLILHRTDIDFLQNKAWNEILCKLIEVDIHNQTHYSKAGHFEIRNVVLGPVVEDGIVIADGLQAGEEVARKGNFLIDSQMQLVGNPSLIDPTIATSVTDVSRTTVKPIDLGDLPPIGPMSVPPSDGSAPDDSGSPTQTMRLAEPSFSSGEENGPSIPPVGEMKLADPPAMSVPGVAP